MSEATAKMHPEAASLTAYARWLTIISWCTYPGVYIVKMVTGSARAYSHYSVCR